MGQFLIPRIESGDFAKHRRVVLLEVCTGKMCSDKRTLALIDHSLTQLRATLNK